MAQDVNKYLDLFAENGGEFLVPYSDFIAKAKNIKMIVFDWDGVFNSGFKGDGVYSNFSEVDSMGVNILRFGYKMLTGNILIAGIISGMENKSTEMFIKREHFNYKCLGFKDKGEALRLVLKEYGVSEDEIAFVYDDILDLAIAKRCGLRFQVGRPASPMFANYTKNRHLADYITASTGEGHAVREVTELLLAAIGMYDDAVERRSGFDDVYDSYITERNAIEPKEFLATKRY